MSWISWEYEIEQDESEIEYIKCQPKIQYIPTEILLKVFSYLNVCDLNYASLVCHRWLESSKYWRFAKKRVINFSDTYSDAINPLSIFTNSERTFSSVILSNVNLDYDSEDFWIANGEELQEVVFKNGLLKKEEFVNVLKYTPYLQVLKIESNNYFKNWIFNKCSYERRILLRSCKHLSLARNNYMNQDIFEYIVATSPNLTELDLSHCFQTMSPLERNRLLDYVLVFITENARKIKSLNFSSTVTDDLFLTRLSEINNLHLRKLCLTFNGCSKNIAYGFPCLVRAQRSVEHFDLTESNSVNDRMLSEVIAYMKNLKVLILNKCHNVTDIGIKEFSKLTKLQSIEISRCDHVTDTGILDGVIFGPPKLHMETINLGLLVNLTDNVICRLAYFYDNIKALDLGGSSNAVTDSSLQIIFKQIRSLRYLNVDNCCKLSDNGFTGIHSDGKRYHSLKNLKGLRTLRACGLYKITDLSLIESFELLEIKEIYLARCGAISENGIKYLAERCPSLELLDLSECKQVDDNAVLSIVKNLKRLKTLKLNNCVKVTDASVQAISENCTELKNLFIKKCSITIDPSKQLSSIRTLRKVSCLDEKQQPPKRK